eukprot:CAMPEP_0178515498 /NCGR_PEP_ID=MMETSP0696-20121128/24588_1 /TAXON_ID=265572 /ORGANISM="Extubocellulus spinifer, Strain CCMP396" /LENGTH=145 /DNA_ID=CAMNT_0020145663 /DNA_START=208 /DNA_END=645 /DNA_ORIENTATION=+
MVIHRAQDIAIALVVALAVHSATGTITSAAAASQCSPPRPLHRHLSAHDVAVSPRGGGFGFPAGWHPFGYGLTELGRRYLEFEGSRDGDVGRFLSSLTSGGRKSKKALKEQWLEVTRVSKKRQSMRIYRTMDDLIDFCLETGFVA